MSSQRTINVSSLNLSLQPGQGPLYSQLIEQINDAIQQGRLQPGDRLPGSRAMAQALGVSRSTLVNTYERLVAEGILVSRAKSGVFIADQPQPTIQPTPNPLTTPGPELPSFDSGADLSVFPLKRWQKSMRASWLNPDPRVLGDDYPGGYPGLKQAIADYLYQLRGLECSPEQIMITAGSRDSLTLLRHTLEQLSPRSRWLTEDPAYIPIRRLLQNWNATDRPFLLPVDDEGCQLPPLAQEPHAPIVLLTPNRQYPSGKALSPQRRQQWLHQLQDEKLWLVEDDYDNEFTFQGRHGIPLMQADRADRVFFVGSFSKVLFRGLRLGFVVAPRRYVDLLQASRQQLGASAALPMQPVLAEFMNNGDFGRHINRMRRHYRHKRDQLLQLVHDQLAPWCEWQPPQGGMHLIIRLREDVRSALLATGHQAPLDQHLAALLSDQMELPALSSHYGCEAQLLRPHPHSVPEGFILGYASPSEDRMRMMIDTMQRQLKQLLD